MSKNLPNTDRCRVLALLRKITRKKPRLIALTFDDGPSRYTGALLDGLKDLGAAATFFMMGENGVGGTSGIINGNEPLLARMWEEGHQLANHTYRHPALRELPEEQISAEFAAVEPLLFHAAGGPYSCFVRTPGGAINETITGSISAPFILWSADTMDWDCQNADAVYSSVLSSAENGSIVLLHDIYQTSVDGALRAIAELKKQGFEFVTVSELMRRMGVQPEDGAVYRKISQTAGRTAAAYKAPKLLVSKKRKSETVQITCRASGQLPLYYTTDGSFPRLSSHRYVSPVSVESGTVFTVVGIDKWGTRTPPATVHAGVRFHPVKRFYNSIRKCFKPESGGPP